MKKVLDNLYYKGNLIMRRLLLIILLATLFIGTNVQAQSPYLTISGANLTYNGQLVILRGDNDPELLALGASIGSGNVAQANVTVDDYVQEAALGGNHIRLGLSYIWYANNKTTFFALLDQNIAWAKADHLWLLPVLFTTPANCYEGYGHSCSIWGSSSEQAQLQSFWVDIATRYANEPTIAGYDILNEPTPSSSSIWYTLATKVCNAIAAVDPNHFSVIESVSDPVFPGKLACPHVLYSVHMYSPIGFTTSGNGTYPGNFTEWDGKSYLYNAQTILGIGASGLNDLKTRYSVNWAKNNNVPMYIGEYGALASANGSLQYVTDVTTAFNAWGVSYAHYDLRHNLTAWGIFPMTGPLPSSGINQGLFNAMKSENAGSVHPDTSVVPTLQPTVPPTNTPSPAPTVTSVVPTFTPTPCPAPITVSEIVYGITYTGTLTAVCQ